MAEGVAVDQKRTSACLAGERGIPAREGVALPYGTENVQPAPLHRDDDSDCLEPGISYRIQGRHCGLLCEIEIGGNPLILHGMDDGKAFLWPRFAGVPKSKRQRLLNL